MSTKKIYLSAILACFLGCLGCGDPTPINDQTYKDLQAPKNPLSTQWQEQLRLIKDQRNRKNFEANIKELKLENQDALLTLITAISDQKQEKNFLHDLATYDKPTQAHLINIILYIDKQNHNLLTKLAQHPDRLSMLEKLKVFKMIGELEPEDQELVAKFEQELEVLDE